MKIICVDNFNRESVSDRPPQTSIRIITMGQEQTINKASSQASNVDSTVMPVLQFSGPKPNYLLSFYNKEGGIIGALDFNGSKMLLAGNAEASAKVFIDWVLTFFQGRLAEERDRCAKLVDHVLKGDGDTYGNAIRRLV